MKRVLVMLAAGTLLAGLCAFAASGKPPVDTKLWRLDCGSAQIADLNLFSDTRAYTGKSMTLSVGCYLIKHGDAYMLWDTGLSAALKGRTVGGATITKTVVEQLAEIGVKPEQVSIIGISHYHYDHTGQAAAFPGATLMIGKGDFDALSATPPGFGADPTALKHWIGGPGKSVPVSGDKDVFGDGSVTIIDTPGHTPGHHALLVKLGSGRTFLLSGDQAHFRENYDSDGVPTFNTNRADTLASFARFKGLAANTKATVIIQHDPRDIAKLPAFPAAAE
ncbi:MAG: MBL fold metallo-hydrolase [Sphingobium sp.]|nr:MBL fold metallo-hydrolase [Sphingobium sp.]